MKELGTVDKIPAKEKLHALSPERIDLSEELFTVIAETLNNLHGTDYSIRFWKMISEEYTRSVITRYDQFLENKMEFSPPFVPRNNRPSANGKPIGDVNGPGSCKKPYCTAYGCTGNIFSGIGFG